ncbi:MAG TPA: hypothetical protein VL171_14690 [Verrucomicrobiae bacterium]|nr:hypothetical protein [Verrucomicrobiae bacterium]
MGTAINNGVPLVVGDDVNTATFHIQGGLHSFLKGITISSNALLNGAASVFVTNLAGNALMEVRRGGGVSIDGSVLTVDRLIVTNGVGSMLSLNGGVINTKTTSINNGSLFSIGDGGNAATFHLLGGVHSFADNLRVLTNGVLSGCGTINGDVTIDPGGTILADCGGTMTFTGVITNDGLIRATSGTALGSYGTLVNNGVIDIINGSTNFHGAFINNGTLLDLSSARITEVSNSGSTVIVKIQSYDGHTFRLQRRDVLDTGTWSYTGSPKSGTGGILSFTDAVSGLTTQRFYRFQIY